jgi:threonine dehydrogenase-like Zn-dependent dehydrogenase
MEAGVLLAPGRAEVRAVSANEVGAQQLRVRIEGCGVCGSNLPVWEGKPWFSYPLEPGAPGHEGWGIVDAVGEEVSTFKPGDRVAMLSSHAFAEYDVAAESEAVLLPPETEGAAFPAEPLACAMNVFARSGILPGSSVAVVGVGFLGALLVQLAKSMKVRVAAFSRREFAREVAESCGADASFEMVDSGEVVQEAVRWNRGSLFDCVIEASGTQMSLDLAAQLTRERGRLVIAGYHQDGKRNIDMQMWNWRGLDVVNAHERDPAVYVAGMRAAVRAVVTGALKPQALYTHAYRLKELSAAFEMLRTRPDGFMKALVVP